MIKQFSKLAKSTSPSQNTPYKLKCIYMCVKSPARPRTSQGQDSDPILAFYINGFAYIKGSKYERKPASTPT